MGNLLSYLYIRAAFSKNGTNYGMKIDELEIFLVFLPGINTAYGFLMWIIDWPWPCKKINFSKFFGVKNKGIKK